MSSSSSSGSSSSMVSSAPYCMKATDTDFRRLPEEPRLRLWVFFDGMAMIELSRSSSLRRGASTVPSVRSAVNGLTLMARISLPAASAPSAEAPAPSAAPGSALPSTLTAAEATATAARSVAKYPAATTASHRPTSSVVAPRCDRTSGARTV
jgi:hypothetical protein